MTNYYLRKEIGDPLEIRIENYLKKCKQKYYQTGAEKLYSKDYCQFLINNSNKYEWAKIQRFNPDFMIQKENGIIWLDVKNAQTIEQNCYEVALEKSKNGEAVYFIVEHSGKIISIEVQNLVFETPNELNNRLGLPCRGSLRMPGVITEWWTIEKVNIWKEKYGSGTPFYVIDLINSTYKFLPIN